MSSYEGIESILTRKEISGGFSNLSRNKKRKVINYFNNTYLDKDIVEDLFWVRFPLSCLELHNLIDLFSYIQRDENEELYRLCLKDDDGYCCGDYSDDIEQKLLKALRGKYKGCRSVEDVLVSMSNNNLLRHEMDLLEMLAFQVYTSKQLRMLGDNYKINLFKYDINSDSIASYNRDDNILNLYISDKELFADEILQAINHEIEHIVQIVKMKNFCVDEDLQVLEYIQDDVLVSLFHDSYSKSNYYALSFEFDAEVKSRIKTGVMLKEISKKNFREYVRGVLYDSQYFSSLKRGYGEDRCDLNCLFEKNMNVLKKKDMKRFKKIISEEYPILMYASYLDNGEFKMKDIDRLVSDMDGACSLEDRKIYYDLIKCRIFSFKGDLETIKKRCKQGIYSSDTRKDLDDLLHVKFDDKYQRYFEKLSVSRKSKSRV